MANKIRWRNQDKLKLQKAVTAFNRKLKRLQTRHPEMEALFPDKVTVKGIKENIATRADFNFQISLLQEFMKKDATKIVDKNGVRMLQYSYRIGSRMNRRVNALRKARLEKSNLTETSAKFGTEARLNLRPRKFKWKTGSTSSWNALLRSLREMSSTANMLKEDDQYRENYMSAMRQMSAYESKYEERIHEMISLLNGTQMIDAMEQDPALEINFLYADTDEIDYDIDIARYVYEGWKRWLFKKGYQKELNEMLERWGDDE